MAQDGRRIRAHPQTTNDTGKKAKQNNMEGPSVSNGTASFACFNGRCEMITRKNGKYFYMGHEITKDQAISILRNASAKLSALDWRKGSL